MLNGKIISTRFCLLLSFLLIVAAVPTVIHSYIGVVEDDNLSVTAVSKTLVGLDSVSTDRRAAWVKDTFDSIDWIERRYGGQGGENILLFMARSYDLKKLYHHPEIGILEGVDLEKDKTESLKGRQDIQVHVLKNRSGNNGLAAYVLMYDTQSITNPVRLQVLNSFKLLFSARKPMTLFFVYDKNSEHGLSFNQSPAADVLQEALSSFLVQNRR